MKEEVLKGLGQILSEEGETVKEEGEQIYGRDSVAVLLDEGTMTISLQGKENVYKEIGSGKNPPNPQFYRAYINRREKMLKRIAQGVCNGIKEGF